MDTELQRARRQALGWMFCAAMPLLTPTSDASQRMPPTTIEPQTDIAQIQTLAQQGDPVMQTRLADLWRSGVAGWIDDGTAERWYRRAALQGNAEAQNDLGALIEQGRAKAQPGESAMGWYKRSAMQEYAPAQFNLGTLLIAENSPVADEKAAFWIAQAADQGFAPAQASLGVLYEEGRGVRPNRRFAVRLFGMAAKAGDLTGQFNLALALEKGEIIEQDLMRARDLYLHAAAGGHPEAAQRLARMMELGLGGPVLKDQAMAWYQSAAYPGTGARP